MGFLWADLGSWCLDKASNFPARNVHSPRETANHRKGEREKEGETEGEKGGEEKATEVKKEKIKVGVAAEEEKEMSVEVVWAGRMRAGTAREKKQKLGLHDSVCVCVHTQLHLERQ